MRRALQQANMVRTKGDAASPVRVHSRARPQECAEVELIVIRIEVRDRANMPVSAEIPLGSSSEHNGFSSRIIALGKGDVLSIDIDAAH